MVDKLYKITELVSNENSKSQPKKGERLYVISLNIGYPAFFHYAGNTSRTFVTSVVSDFQQDGDNLVITTNNTVYKMVKASE